jgi:hypothetical protein
MASRATRHLVGKAHPAVADSESDGPWASYYYSGTRVVAWAVPP